MLWVLKRTVSMRRFFEHPKHMLKIMGKNIYSTTKKTTSVTIWGNYGKIDKKLKHVLHHIL